MLHLRRLKNVFSSRQRDTQAPKSTPTGGSSSALNPADPTGGSSSARNPADDPVEGAATEARYYGQVIYGSLEGHESVAIELTDGFTLLLMGRAAQKARVSIGGLDYHWELGIPIVITYFPDSGEIKTVERWYGGTGDLIASRLGRGEAESGGNGRGWRQWNLSVAPNTIKFP